MNDTQHQGLIPLSSGLPILEYTNRGPSSEKKLPLLICFCTQEAEALPDHVPAAVRRTFESALALREGKPLQENESLLLLPQTSTITRLLVIGLGSEAHLDREKIRRSAGHAGKKLRELGFAHAGLVLPVGLRPTQRERLPATLAEGFLLGAYVFRIYKSPKDNPPPARPLVTYYDPRKRGNTEMIAQAIARAEAICLARDLGNHPSNTMTPSRIAIEAVNMAKEHGLDCQVLTRQQLELLGFRLFLSVAKGSAEEPQLIVLRYEPKEDPDLQASPKTLAFVGKGISFDSGGISIKPSASMEEMKFDMCGAAAVIGAMRAIAQLKPATRVIGVVATCENMPSGTAVKPGDIVRGYNGKQVEILNTDAEGRLILADALAYTCQAYQPDAIVNLATLTGACVVALGHYASGCVSNNASLEKRVVLAGEQSGETIWPLPTLPEYEKSIESKYADIQNTGDRAAGTITAGLFLKHFVGDTPWAHLDIAGTAWGVKHVGHQPNDGATGVGVATLIELALAASSRKNLAADPLR